MTVKVLFWSALAVAICVLLPACLAYSVWDQARSKKRGDRDSGRSAGRCGGNALMELDRLVARPSIEYTVEAETPILQRENDQAGD